jgi:hypothetical protein
VAESAHDSGVQPVDAETFTECMEQLQVGYVAGVAATAGCLMEIKQRDRYGADVMFTRTPPPGEYEETSLYAQLKSTTTIKVDPQRGFLSYTFKKRRYLEQLAAPRKDLRLILIVLAANPIQSSWTSGTHESLTLLHCCYWASFENYAVPTGVAQPTVRISTTNRFTAEALSDILDKVGRGEALG